MDCSRCKYEYKGLDEAPCNECENRYTSKFVAKTNYDRIKEMTVEELADFITDIYASNEHKEIRIDGEWIDPDRVEEWLESEAVYHA